MSPAQVADLLRQTPVTEAMKDIYAEQIIRANLSGLVLTICDLDLVKEELQARSLLLPNWHHHLDFSDALG